MRRFFKNYSSSKVPGDLLTLIACASFIAIYGVSITLIFSPPNLSVDSVVQLYEAQLGKTVNYHPPLVSVLLRLLGGGLKGASHYLIIQFVPLAMALLLSYRLRVKRKFAYIAIVLICLLNPTLFLYSSIVWKDVLFANLLSLYLYFVLQGHITLSGTVLVLLTLTRQQGYFLIPVQLLLVFFGNDKNVKKRTFSSILNILYIACIASAALYMCGNIIQPSNDKALKTIGIKNLLVYNLGMVSSCIEPELNSNLIATLSNYSPDSVDYIANTFSANELYALPTGQLSTVLLRAVLRCPGKFAQKKLISFKRALSLGYEQSVLPVHFGIDGPKEYLSQLQLRSYNPHQRIYDYIQPMLSSFWFKGWFWLLIHIMIIFIGKLVKPRPAFAYFVPLYLCLLYLFAMISADFRYIYFLVPSSFILALNLIIPTDWRTSSSSLHKNPTQT